MSRPQLSELNLREKIGQTGFPSPATARSGRERYGSYEEFYRLYPFTGIYVDGFGVAKNSRFKNPSSLAEEIKSINSVSRIPLLVAADAEYGASGIFPQLHRVTSNMSIGAADSPELAYDRFNLWAKELRSCGVNWAFGPVLDMLNNFFDVMGVRCIGDNPAAMVKLIPSIIKGIQDAGLSATPKHFPGSGNDYRDSHFCNAANDMPREVWDRTYGKIWRSAIEAGADTVMISHMSFPAVDSSITSSGTPRPATASKPVLDILRRNMGFEGVIVTDAVNMKGCASSFEHDDVYIECFNAGNDIILFVGDDYIDVIEKAVLDGRISTERLDESVERILALKEKLGLFEKNELPPMLSMKENEAFEKTSYEISKKAMTLVANKNGTIPFSKSDVKKVQIIALSPYEPFVDAVEVMVEEFKSRGIDASVITEIRSSEQLEKIAKDNDIIIYACYLAMSQPQGMSFYSGNMLSLFHSLSHGAKKSVAVSFGAPSIYYNYFENADMFVNAYSMDEGTMKAFVGGILGDFKFTGKSPVELKPQFKIADYK